MLNINRRIGETIKISEDIEIVILGIRGNQVLFGIEAPKGVSVDKEEVRLKERETKWNH